MEKFTIACLIHDAPCRYYAGEGDHWDNNIHRACLYTPLQAEAKLKTLKRKFPEAEIFSYIQDKKFNYYDGKKFVYDLSDAKSYAPAKAKERLSALNSAR